MLVEPFLSSRENTCSARSPSTTIPAPCIDPPLHVARKGILPAQPRLLFTFHSTPVDPPEEQGNGHTKEGKHQPVVFKGALLAIFGMDCAW